tara:strand:+ start:5465 stop:5632 length:168 start_codon:yes stop_codon:yes gene_type:complete
VVAQVVGSIPTIGTIQGGFMPGSGKAKQKKMAKKKRHKDCLAIRRKKKSDKKKSK